MLGAAAYGIARVRKPAPESIHAERPDERETTSGQAPSNPEETPEPAASDPGLSAVVDPVDSAESPRNVRHKVPPSVTSAGPPVASRQTLRKVSFVIIPSGAKLTLDGREETWFSRVFSLKTGLHPASASVEGSKCCEAFRGSITVESPPDNDPDQVQRIGIRLKPLPATVSLSGAPSSAHLVCTDIMLTVFSGGTKTVQLREPTWSGRCQFMPPPPGESIRKAVQLRAGEHNNLPWPQK
jgi:hypothetical protein